MPAPTLVFALGEAGSWQCLGAAFRRIHSRQLFACARVLVFCPGLQRLGLCGGGFLGHACGFDAGGAFGGGLCGIYGWLRSSFVRLDGRALDHLCWFCGHAGKSGARSPWFVRHNGHAATRFLRRRPHSPCFLAGFFNGVWRLQAFGARINGTPFGGGAFAMHNAARECVRRRRNGVQG
jgi:hypothetical protein